MRNLTTALDRVANELEARGLTALAAGIDTVSNSFHEEEYSNDVEYNEEEERLRPEVDKLTRAFKALGNHVGSNSLVTYAAHTGCENELKAATTAIENLVHALGGSEHLLHGNFPSASGTATKHDDHDDLPFSAT